MGSLVGNTSTKNTSIPATTPGVVISPKVGRRGTIFDAVKVFLHFNVPVTSHMKNATNEMEWHLSVWESIFNSERIAFERIFKEIQNKEE